MNNGISRFFRHLPPGQLLRAGALVALSLANGYSQNGLAIPSSHPRLWFDGPNGTRLAQAKTWFSSHPFTPSTMEDWALHYLVSGNAADCTGTNHAIDLAKKFLVPLSELEGTASDNMRWSGEEIALVYDWCFTQMTPSDAQLLRDRWAGTTSGPSDSIHIPTDLASVPASKVLTSRSSPFLPNMANNNLIVITGGTGCRQGIFGIVGYTDANTVTLDGDPTNGNSASGCTGRVTGYVDSELPTTWAGRWAGTWSPGSNYDWGYYRNEVLWGVALYGDSPYAPAFLDSALGPAASSRWSAWSSYINGTGTFAAPKSNAIGGVLTEGSQYGQYSWGYQTAPNVTAKLLGRDLFTESNWFREAVYYIIYSSTVAPTKTNVTNSSYYQFFSMSDDETAETTNGSYPGVAAVPSVPNGGYYAGMMMAAAQEYATVNVGKHARQWLNTVNPGLLRYQAAVDPGGATLPFSGSLPLDYFASGLGMLMTKNSWSPTATQIRTITATASSSGHGHKNSGDFAMLRNGVWLTRETAEYATNIIGPYGQPTAVNLGSAHNVLASGPATATTCNVTQGLAGTVGFGQTIRLESQPSYSYQVMDLTPAYRSLSGQQCRDDNPYIGSIQREFLFIRPLETLVIFDRVLSVDDRKGGDTHPSVPPASNVKTVYIHSIATPTLTSNTATFNAEGQTLKVYTLLPLAPSYNVVAEGSQAQQRLEISDTGQAQSYFLNILQGRDSTTGQDFTTSQVVDNGTYYTLTLQHPTLGTAVVTLVKGATSTGGTFGYSASGTPTTASLATSVNRSFVDDTGVTWGAGTGAGTKCDLNGDGTVNQTDVSIAIQQALGLAPCTADLHQTGVCNVIDVQRIINATLTGVCRIGP